MTPAQFIALRRNNPLSERAGAQGHFDDLCELLGVDKPRDPDNYCFERGAKKAGGGDGWADVWTASSTSRPTAPTGSTSPAPTGWSAISSSGSKSPSPSSTQK